MGFENLGLIRNHFIEFVPLRILVRRVGWKFSHVFLQRDHIDAVVDDKAATVSTMRWNYVNGGRAEMNSSYSLVQGQMMVTSQTGTVEEPNYQGTITATLSDYTINPPLDDSIFNAS